MSDTQTTEFMPATAAASTAAASTAASTALAASTAAAETNSTPNGDECSGKIGKIGEIAATSFNAVDIIVTLDSTDKLGRRVLLVHNDSCPRTLTLLDKTEQECALIANWCSQSIATIDIFPFCMSQIQITQQHDLMQRWTNICGKVHFTQNGIRDEMIGCILDCKFTTFGTKKLLMTVHGNFMLSEGSTTALFRGFNSCTMLTQVMQHIFKPHSCITTTLHMLVCSLNVRHMVFIHSKILDNILISEHKASTPRWNATNIESMDNVHGMKSLRLDNFNQTWLQSMRADSVSSMRMQISSHGSVNLFITPKDDTFLVADFEEGLNQFCTFFADLCVRCT